MPTYTTLAPGSRGDQVRRLQTRLNGHGADLAVDGVFGPATRDAVKSYQASQGLSADGVVGQATWSRLLAGTPASLPAAPKAAAPNDAVTVRTASGGGTVSAPAAQALAQYEKGYTPGEGVAQAQEAWQALETGGPGDYQSPYAAALEELGGKIAGRGPFTYDPENDALYRQYRDQYLNLGRRAMADTMGRAAALTGGYASSYGQNVGQQAYDEYLQQLNSKVPELYTLAWDRYTAEGDELAAQYDRLSGAEAAAYDRWRDSVADHRAAQEAAWRRYTDARDTDYDRWSDMLDYWRSRSDDETDAWWRQAQWDYQRQRDAVADEQWERQFAARTANTGSAAGSRSSSRSPAPAPADSTDVTPAAPAADTSLVHIPPFGYIYADEAREMVARGELEWVTKDDHRTVLTDRDGNPIARRPKSRR